MLFTNCFLRICPEYLLKTCSQILSPALLFQYSSTRSQHNHHPPEAIYEKTFPEGTFAKPSTGL